MDPGLSELGTWNGAGAAWETGGTSAVAEAELGGAAVAAVGVEVVMAGGASDAGAGV